MINIQSRKSREEIVVPVFLQKKKKKKGSYLPASTAIEQLESSVDGHWLWGPLTLYHNERPGLNEFSL